MNVTFEGERFFEVELRFRRCTVCFNVNGMFEVYCKLKLGRLTDCTKKNDALFVGGLSLRSNVNGMFKGKRYAHR